MARLWPFSRTGEPPRADVDAAIDAATDRLEAAVIELEHFAKFTIEEQEARKR